VQIGQARVHLGGGTADALERSGRRLAEVLDSGTAVATVGVLRGADMPAEQVRTELGEQAYAALVAAQLFVVAGPVLSSPFRGHRIGPHILFSDPDVEEDEQDPLYLDPLWEAELLVRLMLPRRGRRALDVGCGCGVLTVALAGAYERVVAMDINPRAIEMSRLNAALNGVSNVDFVESDMYERLDGRFDRIVFNSPTNEEGEQFRDLLEAGEGILERFFTGLPAHLAPDGLAEVNLAMNDYPGSRFADRLRAWLALPESRLDATILVSQREVPSPGHEWKRGWLLVSPGTGRIAELDWPYHVEDAGTALSDTVQRFHAGPAGPVGSVGSNGGR
jgi:predicted nicotinamide N-methyase